MKLPKFSSLILAGIVLLAGGAVSYRVWAQGSATSTAPAGIQISFPIPELGSCASRAECRRYCDRPDNLDACIAFAKAHGLVNNTEATRAQKFANVLKSERGPGGCDSPQTCKNFCSDIQNLGACVKWASDHSLKNDNFDTAQKIQKYLKAGGKMPGDCTARE